MSRTSYLRGRKFFLSFFHFLNCCFLWPGATVAAILESIILIIFLPRRAGGLTIINSTGKIDITNTYEERLKLLETDALPAVRTILFGENQNRKFKN